MDAFIYRGQLESIFFLNMSGCPLTVTQSRITLSSDGNLGLRKQRCHRERSDSRGLVPRALG